MTVALTEDLVQTGISFLVEYATLPSETWGGTGPVSGFGLQLTFGNLQ